MSTKVFCDDCEAEITYLQLISVPEALLKNDPENHTGKDLCSSCAEIARTGQALGAIAGQRGITIIQQAEETIKRQQEIDPKTSQD